MPVKPKPNTKVKGAFERAFSPRRLVEADCNERRAPCPPAKERTDANGQPAKVPRNLKPLPADWSPEELLFFGNWRKEIAALNDALIATAGDQARILHRAKKIYFELAWALTKQLDATAATDTTQAGARR